MTTLHPALHESRNLTKTISKSILREVFPSHLELVPQLNETYELELAYLESRLMSEDELIRNGAYFSQVRDQLTRHFLMCSGEPIKLPDHSSSRLKSFFKTNQFKTGYATHGLFPYRGKFHPQMIKGLINAMGLKPGDTILDPMMGSGTVLIEASLMGIRSIGVDASPFCQFMAETKFKALTVPLAPLKVAVENAETVFEYFGAQAGHAVQGSKMKYAESRPEELFETRNGTNGRLSKGVKNVKLPKGCDSKEIRNFLLLAYLDSAGYSERSNRRTPYAQFKAILERYVFVCEKIQSVLEGTEDELAKATALKGDARDLELKDESVDGVLYSPPYSFAVDYVDNDSFHLKYFGIDTELLRSNMVGLRGRNDRQKFEFYRDDMNKILSECARVLREGHICTIIVGTNNNQLSKVQGVAPEDVQGIDDLLISLGASHRLRLIRKMSRQITGMANTMRTEYILMMEKSA